MTKIRSTTGLWVIMIAVSLSCKPMAATSSLKDVYKIDSSSDSKGNTRRHEASILEINWTIKAPGCSGILLNPTMVLTASHCKLAVGALLRSGFAVTTQSPSDMTVSEVLETNTDLDYALVRVSWTRPMPSQQTFPPYLAISPEQIFSSQISNSGDTLFSVGFPDDKAKDWIGTYSEGQAKSMSPGRLDFNIGLINGNSGGAVLKKENLMLTAIAIGGNHKFKEGGWDQADANNPNDWNFGTPLWSIYAVSKNLQQAFPGGKNEFNKDLNLPRTSLYLQVEEGQKKSLLSVSGNVEAESVVLCPPAVFPCTAQTAGAVAMKYEGHKAGRRFYTTSLELAASQDVAVIALDKAGTVIGMRHLQLQRMRP